MRCHGVKPALEIICRMLVRARKSTGGWFVGGTAVFSSNWHNLDVAQKCLWEVAGYNCVLVKLRAGVWLKSEIIGLFMIYELSNKYYIKKKCFADFSCNLKIIFFYNKQNPLKNHVLFLSSRAAHGAIKSKRWAVIEKFMQMRKVIAGISVTHTHKSSRTAPHQKCLIWLARAQKENHKLNMPRAQTRAKVVRRAAGCSRVAHLKQAGRGAAVNR